MGGDTCNTDEKILQSDSSDVWKIGWILAHLS